MSVKKINKNTRSAWFHLSFLLQWSLMHRSSLLHRNGSQVNTQKKTVSEQNLLHIIEVTGVACIMRKERKKKGALADLPE